MELVDVSSISKAREWDEHRPMVERLRHHTSRTVMLMAYRNFLNPTNGGKVPFSVIMPDACWIESLL